MRLVREIVNKMKRNDQRFLRMVVHMVGAFAHLSSHSPVKMSWHCNGLIHLVCAKAAPAHWLSFPGHVLSFCLLSSQRKGSSASLPDYLCMLHVYVTFGHRQFSIFLLTTSCWKRESFEQWWNHLVAGGRGSVSWHLVGVLTSARKRIHPTNVRDTGNMRGTFRMFVLC